METPTKETIYRKPRLVRLSAIAQSTSKRSNYGEKQPTSNEDSKTQADIEQNASDKIGQGQSNPIGPSGG